jgi:hypothetical protein
MEGEKEVIDLTVDPDGVIEELKKNFGYVPVVKEEPVEEELPAFTPMEDLKE